MEIRVAYACDENYAALTAISAVSLLKHNPGATIVLLGCNLGHSALEMVRSRVEKAGGVFVYEDVSKSISNIAATGTSGYTSYAAYARVLIANALGDNGRVLYLDCDTLVTGPLQELFEMPLKGRPCAMGIDCIPFAYHKYINMEKNSIYFNSGVMLINLGEWRKQKCQERFLKEVSAPHGPNPLGDQDILVRLFSEDTMPISPKWNFLSQFFLVSYHGLKRIVAPQRLPFSEKEYDGDKKDVRICHFSGHTLGRPWYKNSRHPMRAAYRQSARDAGLPDVAEQARPLPLSYRIQYFLYRLLPQRLFDRACHLLYRMNIRFNYHV